MLVSRASRQVTPDPEDGLMIAPQDGSIFIPCKESLAMRWLVRLLS